MLYDSELRTKSTIMQKMTSELYQQGSLNSLNLKYRGSQIRLKNWIIVHVPRSTDYYWSQWIPLVNFDNDTMCVLEKRNDIVPFVRRNWDRL